MPEMICEYEIGTRARIAVGDDIEGIITAVLFRSEAYHTYELTWVHDGEVKSGWFLAIELKISGEEKGAGGLAIAPRTEDPGPKFKEGDPIKVSGDMDTAYRECSGIVKAVHRTGPTRWAYDTQLYACTDGFITQFHEDELEAGDPVVEDSGKAAKGE